MEQQIKAEVRISINDGSSPREDQKGPLAGKGDDDGPRRRPLRKGPKKRTKTGCLSTCSVLSDALIGVWHSRLIS